MEYVQLFVSVSDEVTRWAQARCQIDDFLALYCANNLRTYLSQLQRLIPVCGQLAVQSCLLDLKSFIDNLLLVHNSYYLDQAESERVEYVPEKIYTGGRGRPKLSIPVEEISILQRSGMTMKSISSFFGFSERTLRRNKWQITDLLPISDDDLREELQYLKEENPVCGALYALGHLTAHGFKVSRERVRQMLRELDPMGTISRRSLKILRCVYFVPGPNFMWHMDGNEKLQKSGFYIHGMVDGYSRKPLYLFCSTNKKPSTVLKGFEKAVQEYGYPLKVRSDFGQENTGVARHMLEKFGIDKNCFVTGKSTRNTRVERFWREVNKISWQYRMIFRYLTNEMLYDFYDAVDKFCLHYVFLPRIQKSLDSFRTLWNSHKIRTAKYKSPDELYLTGTFPSPRTPLQERNFADGELEELDGEIEEIDEAFNSYLRATDYLPDPCQDDGHKGIGWYIMLRDSLKVEVSTVELE